MVSKSRLLQSAFDKLPRDWHVRELQEIGVWSGGGTPPKNEPDNWTHAPGGIPWVSPKDMTNGIIVESQDQITEIGRSARGLPLLPIGTILMVVRSGILRNTVPIAVAGTELTINQDLKALRVHEGLNSRYVYYALTAFGENIRRSCVKSGTTVESIDFLALKAFRIPVPRLAEQCKIVAILSSVDDAIFATQRIIDQTEVVKRGLMQQLLTQGIGHTTFKPTEIGEIPTEWDVVHLGRLGSFANGLNKGKSDFGHGTLFVNVADVASRDKIDFEQLNRVSLTDSEIERYKLQPNDIVLVRSYGNPEKLGYPTLFAGYTQNVVHSGFTIRFRPDLETIDPKFLLYVLKHDRVRAEMLQKSTISANNNINQQALSSIGIPLPSLDEQRHVAEVLVSVDAKISYEKEELNRLAQLKSALMQVLLTGKVRVHVNEPSEVSV